MRARVKQVSGMHGVIGDNRSCLAGGWRGVMAALILIGGLGGCEKIKGPDPNYEYLMMRVDDLEEKVHLLELRIEQISQEGGVQVAKDADAVEITVSALSPPSLLTSTGGTDLESQLAHVEDQHNVLRLRVRQLEAAPRSQLPELLERLGISAPEVVSLQSTRAELMARLVGLPTGGAEALGLAEEVRMIDLKIELEADNVRSRLIEQEQVESSKINALLQGAEPRSTELAPPGGDSTPPGAAPIRGLE
jgi:hypothetical protein